MKFKTWQYESLVILVLLISTLFFKKIRIEDILCLLGVWFTFMHGQVSERMQEKQGQMAKPDVECYKWSGRYFLIKEILWIMFFLTIKSYPALMGSIVFALYPFWRKLYNKYFRYS